MPKATLKFTLPEEQDEHLLAIHAGDMWCALCKFDAELRSLERPGENEPLRPSEVRTILRSYMDLSGIDFDMVS